MSAASSITKIQMRRPTIIAMMTIVDLCTLPCSRLGCSLSVFSISRSYLSYKSTEKISVRADVLKGIMISFLALALLAIDARCVI
jgi:hypothetical protein